MIQPRLTGQRLSSQHDVCCKNQERAGPSNSLYEQSSHGLFLLNLNPVNKEVETYFKKRTHKVITPRNGPPSRWASLCLRYLSLAPTNVKGIRSIFPVSDSGCEECGQGYENLRSRTIYSG